MVGPDGTDGTVNPRDLAELRGVVEEGRRSGVVWIPRAPVDQAVAVMGCDAFAHAGSVAVVGVMVGAAVSFVVGRGVGEVVEVPDLLLVCPLMTKPQAAAVYARISSDDGTALGVARQVADCRQLADRLGWVVAEEYVDNDVSAYTGKRRPAYERMLADLADGHRDGVVVYHSDRLTRRPVELEHFFEVLKSAEVHDVEFVNGGALDVANGDDLLVLRVQGAVAANESESKGRRVRRKMLENAVAGRPHGGRNRPFGFEADRITHRADEAGVIRAMAARYIAGEGFRSLALWLEAEGVRTSSGKPWRTTSVKTILSSGRVAGLREHKGEVIGPAVWAPIISEADRAKVLARREAAKRTKQRTARRYLLSGMCRCGKCDTTLLSAARETTRRYVCKSGPDHGGCGHLTVVAAPVEELVTAAVLYRLDTPELAGTLAGRAAADSETAELSEALSADKVLLDELAGLFATKQITSREWMTARKPVTNSIEDLERRLSRLTASDALAGWAGNGQELGRQWAELNLTRQVAIVKAVVDHVVIGPGQSGARTLDPDRVEIVWRL